jgi:hypothetical protein
MRNALFFFLFIGGCVSAARSQPDSLQTYPIASSAVYAEVGGPALYYSFNYDLLVIPSVGFRMGFSFVQGTDQHWSLMLPIFINLLPAANSWTSSNFEIDAGIVYRTSGVNIWYEALNNSGLYYSFGLGYRYESSDNGILFRIMATPLFFSDQIFLYGGVSFGWAF